MRVDIPHTGWNVTDLVKEPISYMWYRWFRSLWETQGWSKTFSVYQNRYIAAESMARGSTIRTVVNGSAYGIGFPAGADTMADGSVFMPNNYKEGTSVFVDLLWAPTSANTNPVEWRTHTSHANVSAEFSACVSTVLTSTPGGVASKLQRVESPSISTMKKGSVFKFSIGRYGLTGVDTYPDTALLLGLAIRYQIEGHGFEVPRPSEV